LRELVREGPASVEEWQPYWEDFRGNFEPKYSDAVAMALAGCKADVNYFRLTLDAFSLRGPSLFQSVGSTLFYSQSKRQLNAKWIEFLKGVMANPDLRWKELDLEELESILGNEFGYDPED
jgi:hypothetical protein